MARVHYFKCEKPFRIPWLTNFLPVRFDIIDVSPHFGWALCTCLELINNLTLLIFIVWTKTFENNHAKKTIIWDWNYTLISKWWKHFWVNHSFNVKNDCGTYQCLYNSMVCGIHIRVQRKHTFSFTVVRSITLWSNDPVLEMQERWESLDEIKAYNKRAVWNT